MIAEKKGDWYHLKLPAIDAEGKALWPEKFPIDRLQKIRRLIGEKRFSGLFQQDPMDLVERMFSHPVRQEPKRELKIFGFWDPAFKKEEAKRDYNAFAAGGIDQPQLNITAGEIWRSKLKESYDKIEKLYHLHNLSLLYIEGNKGEDGPEIELSSRGLNVKTIFSVEKKDFRIQQYLLMNWDLLVFSNLVSPKFLKQILEYSDLAKHDDAPDALSMLIKYIEFGRKAQSLNKRMAFYEYLLSLGANQ
ncbi:MAG: hypothetical protein GW938_15545 [Leptospira sp.]|nr:hypothetical protein [Leptospira sp.]